MPGNVLQVRVVVDDAGCNGNEDINFQFTGFVIVVLVSVCVLLYIFFLAVDCIL